MPGSDVSNTDMQLFFGVANPNSVRDKDDVDSEEEEEAPEEVTFGDGDDEEDEGRGGKASMRRIEEAEEGEDEDDEEGGEEEGGEEEGEEEDDEEEEEDGRAPLRKGRVTDARLPMSAEELMLEKQSVLLEMERLKAQGIGLTREYNLDDNLADMQFEVRRHLLRLDEQNAIGMMKDGMKLLFGGIETGNRAIGSILQLDGWSAHACGEMDAHKYDQSLSAIYRKYWRRGVSSPEMEIAFGVLGSIGTWHVKQQFKNQFTKGLGGGLGGSSGKKPLSGLGAPSKLRDEDDDSSDEEGLPANFMSS